MKCKKLFAGILSTALVLTAGFPLESVAAATVKGTILHPEFKDGEWRGYDACLGLGEYKTVPEGDYSATVDFAIPKTELPESDFEAEDPNTLDFTVQMQMNFVDWEKNEDLLGVYCNTENFGLEREKGKAAPECVVYREEGPESVSNVTAEEKGDYYIVHMKDVPFPAELMEWSEEEQKDIPYTGEFPSGETISLYPLIKVCLSSWNMDYSSFVVISNASVRAGSDAWKVDFDQAQDPENPGIGDVWFEGNNVERLYAMEYDDENILGVQAESLTVKKGKSKKLALSLMTADSIVEYSIDKKKVANVSLKDGNLVIKGKKKGKAVVTLVSNGVTKTVAVKVK